MKLVSQVLSLALVATFSLANSDIDKKVLDFEKEFIQQNPKFTLKDLKILAKKEIPNAKGWYGYIINLNLEMGGKAINFPDTVFSNGSVITKELLDMDKKIDLSDFLAPDFDAKYYSDDHIIAGNKNAKHKLALFSDPHCPACIKYAPSIIDYVKKNPDMVVLYYYDYPLTTIHHLAEITVKASIVAKKQGIKDVEYKLYTANLTKDAITEVQALEEINKVLGTKITMEEANKEDVKKHLEADLKIAETLIIKGTPTLFVNGKKEEKRGSFMELK